MIKRLTNSIFFPIGLMLIALIAGMATQVIGTESRPNRLLEPLTNTPSAEDFSLINPDGEYESLSDFNGNFILINFWATWCPPCIKEMPSLDRLQDQLVNENFKVIAVHVGPSVAGVNEFLSRLPLKMKILIDKDISLVTWGVTALPTTYLVNPQGKIIYKAMGEREWDSEEMVNEIRTIMSDQGKLVQLDSV